MIAHGVRRRALSGLVALGAAALLLIGCSAGPAPEGGQTPAEAAPSVDRSISIMVSEPLGVEMPFLVQDSSGVLAESVVLDVGAAEVTMDIPAEAADTISVTIDVDTVFAEGYTLESSASMENSFGGGSLMYFSFTVVRDAPEVVTSGTDPTGSITWKMGSDRGYTYDLTLDLFAPVDGGAANGHTIGDACEFDPAQDIAIPGQLTATATTADFATPITAALMIQHQTDMPYTGTGAQPQRDDARLKIEQYFADGPKCGGWSSTGFWAGSNPISVQWTDPVESGDSVESTFVIIVKNYYTPNTPDGDPELLDWIEVRSGMAGGSNEQTGQFSDTEGAALGGASTKGLNLNGAVVGPRL